LQTGEETDLNAAVSYLLIKTHKKSWWHKLTMNWKKSRA